MQKDNGYYSVIQHSSSRLLVEWRIQPFVYISVAIGIFAMIVLLMSLFSGELSPFRLIFGRGGEERMLAYPVVLRIIWFGGYLVGASQAGDEQ